MFAFYVRFMIFLCALKQKQAEVSNKVIPNVQPQDELAIIRTKDEKHPEEDSLMHPIHVGQCTQSDDELSFKNGEELNIIHTAAGEGRWLAYSQTTGKRGYVPSEFPVTSTFPIHTALYDYVPFTDEKLYFEKGDLLHIIHATNKDWWYARSERTGKKGYIPSNSVTSLVSGDKDNINNSFHENK